MQIHLNTLCSFGPHDLRRLFGAYMQCKVTVKKLTFTVKKFFLILGWNFLCITFCQVPLVLLLGTMRKSLDPSSLHLPFRSLQIWSLHVHVLAVLGSPRPKSVPNVASQVVNREEGSQLWHGWWIQSFWWSKGCCLLSLLCPFLQIFLTLSTTLYGSLIPLRCKSLHLLLFKFRSFLSAQLFSKKEIWGGLREYTGRVPLHS